MQVKRKYICLGISIVFIVLFLMSVTVTLFNNTNYYVINNKTTGEAPSQLQNPETKELGESILVKHGFYSYFPSSYTIDPYYKDGSIKKRPSYYYAGTLESLYYDDGNTVSLYDDSTYYYQTFDIYIRFETVTQAGQIGLYVHIDLNSASQTFYAYLISKTGLEQITSISGATDQWIDIYANYDSDNIIDGKVTILLREYNDAVTSSMLLEVDEAWIKPDAIYENIQTYYFVSDNNTVYHTLELTTKDYGYVHIYVPETWEFVSVNPSAEVYTGSDSDGAFYGIDMAADALPNTKYVFVFKSYDTWNYPEESLSRIAIYNQKGELLPFDNFKVYRSDVGIGYATMQWKQTWYPNEESDESGCGFAENFDSIDEWGGSPYIIASVANGVLNQTVVNTGTSNAYTGIWIYFPSGISTTEYQYFQIRYWYYSESDDFNLFYPQVHTTDGVWKDLFYADALSGGWQVKILNLYELTGYGKTIDYIKLTMRAAPGTNATVLVDYVIVYKIETTVYANYHPASSSGTPQVKYFSAYVSDMGLTFYIPSYASNEWSWWWSEKLWYQDRIDITQYRYLFIKFYTESDQYKDVNIRIRFEQQDGTAIYKYTGDFYVNNGTYILDLQEFAPDDTYRYVRELLFAILASSSDGKDDWLTINTVAFISSPLDFKIILYPIYHDYKNSISWYRIYNIFGDLLVDEPRLFSTYQDFIVNTVDFKIKNQKSEFVHISLQRNGYEYTEWLASNEVAHYNLYPGTYTLVLTYESGGTATFNLNINSDSYYTIQGETLADVIYNIQNVNSTLSSQILNVNISLTNWNSKISNQVVNININLENVNSSLGDLILSNRQIILNNNSAIYNQILANYAEITNTRTEVINQILSNREIIINNNSVICNLLNNIDVSLYNNFSIIKDLENEIKSIVIANNSVIFNLENEIKSIVLANNSAIYNQILNNYLKIITVNSSIANISLANRQIIISNASVIQNLINNLESVVIANNSVIRDLLSNVKSIVISNNSVIFNLVSDVRSIMIANNSVIYNQIVLVQNLINNMYSTMNNSFAEVNVELGILKSNISTLIIDENEHFLVLNASIDNLNQNVTIRLADLNNTVVKNFTTTVEQLNNITQLIERLYNHFKLALYNNITGLGLSPEKFKIYVNGERVFSTEYKTLSDYVNVTIMDFFNRTIYNATVPANATIDIGIPVGELGIYNNNSFTILINISVPETGATVPLLLKPHELITLELLFGQYQLDIFRVIYSQNTGEILRYEKIDTLHVQLDVPSYPLELQYESPYMGYRQIDWLTIGLIAVVSTVIGIITKFGWRRFLRDVLHIRGRRYHELAG